jgi:hypothetical protein
MPGIRPVLAAAMKKMAAVPRTTLAAPRRLRPGRQVHARAQGRDDEAARAQEQPKYAADPAQEQLQRALAPISLSGSLLLHIVLPFFRPLLVLGSGYLVLF